MMAAIKKILLFPLWLGLLALPFMGPVAAAQLAAVLIAGQAVWRALLRFIASGRPSTGVGRSLPFVATLEAIRRKVLESPKTRQRSFIAAGLFFSLSPLFLNNYYLDILSLAGLYALLAAGLNITVGYTGLLDLGYAAFYGIGAYVYGLLSTRLGLSFWLGLPLGGAAAAFFGLILGMITLRLRGDYLAIVTLGFVQIVYLILNNWDSVTQGPNGILQIGRPALGGFVLSQPIHFYYLILFILVISSLAIHRLIHSQIGRAWIAIREDVFAAEAMGIDTVRMKVLAFLLGAGIAGISGVLFAAKYTFISPESFNFLESVRILSMVVLGGMGSLPGSILGAILLTVLPELLRGLSQFRMLIFGIALVVMMVFRPQGLMGKKS